MICLQDQLSKTLLAEYLGLSYDHGKPTDAYRVNQKFPKRNQIIEKYFLETHFGFCRHRHGDHLYSTEL
jgi:hypothetical protein